MTTMPPTSIVLPTLTYHGTNSLDDHHTFGLQMGSSFANTIKARFADKKEELDNLESLAKTHPALYSAFIDLHESVFPEYMAEVRGISEGSGVSFDRTFLQNIPLEFSDCTSESSRPPMIGVSCSDFMVCPATSIEGSAAACAVAHNEDNNLEDVNRTALVTGRFGDGPTFEAYTYLGELPSGAFAYNDAGIGFTLNWVGPSEPQCPGLGRGFLSRALLGATTLDEAIAIATDPRGAAGHNYQLMSWRESTPIIVNVEAAPRGVHSVRPIGNAFFHANQYVTLNVPQVYGNSSVHRTARAVDLLPSIAASAASPKQARAAMLAAIGDQEDQQWPIFHDDVSHAAGDLSDWTVASAFFDLRARSLTIYAGNPSNPNLGRMLVNRSLTMKA
eukprot:CAMPEP_0115835776 /NCGR_PEP_ID=MMETSP0287-20121206/4367_1 /TAXON_ID=412157 /ORGANISM="Chrysochromulina rotalis, Strain UIO044" /LENGTH=388 /DNA_ID=CAMNT_0003289241 /DNA_START=21 /DNA_END=1187 /DNA_ORIENTATION=-